MKKEKIRRIHLIYSIVTLAVAVIAGGCLIAACLGIYYANEAPTYSRLIVYNAFQPIRLPVYACLVLVLGGFLLDILLPSPKKPDKPEKNYPFILSQLHRKANMEVCPDALRSDIGRQRKLRRIHSIVSAVISVICGIIFLSYALNFGNYVPKESPDSVLKAMWVLLPCLGVSFCYLIIASFIHASSIQKEITLMRQIPAAKGNEKKAAKDPAKAICAARILLTVVGIALVVCGIYFDGVIGVLTKAVNICTECIGLG